MTPQDVAAVQLQEGQCFICRVFTDCNGWTICPSCYGDRRKIDDLVHKLALSEQATRAAEVAYQRASGALVDAESVPTEDVEVGIRSLTVERDALRERVKWLEEGVDVMSSGCKSQDEVALFTHWMKRQPKAL